MGQPRCACFENFTDFSRINKKTARITWIQTVFLLVLPRCLVAEVGFEPHDLRVMSPTSYQAALLRDIRSVCLLPLLAFRSLRLPSVALAPFVRPRVLLAPGGAGDRDRTGTILPYHGILSPGRLPVPPHRRSAVELLRPVLGSHQLLYHIPRPLSTLFSKIFSPFFAFRSIRLFQRNQNN